MSGTGLKLLAALVALCAGAAAWLVIALLARSTF
jgi:hypothetical protein